MKGKPAVTCKRCGNCCRADLNAYITDKDIKRWRREGRDDILHILENESAVWAGDHLVSAKNGAYLHDCPFLVCDGKEFSCAIYETRPDVCKDYDPGSSLLCPLYAGGSEGEG
ncbi:MAG: YkgJ family cysteine cluster protein [Deltaproteobacteria bacterium]|nr:YkgJ family cysteine cluster protein [Deltaproteobacteria bacterium]